MLITSSCVFEGVAEEKEQMLLLDSTANKNTKNRMNFTKYLKTSRKTKRHTKIMSPIEWEPEKQEQTEPQNKEHCFPLYALKIHNICKATQISQYSKYNKVLKHLCFSLIYLHLQWEKMWELMTPNCWQTAGKTLRSPAGAEVRRTPLDLVQGQLVPGGVQLVGYWSLSNKVKNKAQF